jgi:DNA-binding NarL/FixJ family response regulator
VRVIVTDRDPLARRLVIGALRHAGLIVVAEARTTRDAIDLTRHYRVDVVVIAHAPPEIDAVEAIPALRLHAPVLVLTPAPDDELGLRVLRAGAAGCLSKDIDLDALPRAIQGAHQGEAAISRRLAMQVVERFRELPADGAGLRPVRSRLTDREWEVLDLLAGGAAPADIADALVLSSETVRSHQKSLYRKLGVHSREQAMIAASRLRVQAGLAGTLG